MKTKESVQRNRVEKGVEKEWRSGDRMEIMWKRRTDSPDRRDLVLRRMQIMRERMRYEENTESTGGKRDIYPKRFKCVS